MLRRFSSSAALLICAALIAIPVSAAQRARKEEPPPPPPFRVDVATKAMAFARLAIQVPTRTVIGQYSFDIFCTGANHNDIFSDDAFNPRTSTDYGTTFTDEATRAGYRLSSAQSNLFDTKEVGAELLVGAAIKSLKENGCGSVKQQMDATITV